MAEAARELACWRLHLLEFDIYNIHRANVKKQTPYELSRLKTVEGNTKNIGGENFSDKKNSKEKPGIKTRRTTLKMTSYTISGRWNTNGVPTYRPSPHYRSQSEAYNNSSIKFCCLSPGSRMPVGCKDNRQATKHLYRGYEWPSCTCVTTRYGKKDIHTSCIPPVNPLPMPLLDTSRLPGETRMYDPMRTKYYRPLMACNVYGTAEDCR